MNRSLVHASIVWAVLLRIAIPAGFMPANGDDGWYLKLCPDGMSAQVMAALFGDAHAHHHAPDDQAFVQCELGSALGSCDALVNSAVDAGLHFDIIAPSAELVTRPIQLRAWLGFQSRAPPHSSLI